MNIKELKPTVLWNKFSDICSIPHPSKKEEKLVNYIKEFAKKNNLDLYIDEVSNIIIRKPAKKGYENLKTVILQAHLDMVPQKNNDKQHDFEKDPIVPIIDIDNEWVKADGTTLGADNGIGLAAALAILEDNSIEHGPIECLFTVDEETGMTGAFGLKPGILKGDILLNLDSEEEGELFVGCAGGLNATAKLKYNTRKVSEDEIGINLSITGLKGGHSGCDIHLQRGNANKIMIRLLMMLVKKYDIGIIKIEGGDLRNAIPREAYASIVAKLGRKDEIIRFINEYIETIKKELIHVENNINVKYDIIDDVKKESAFDSSSRDVILRAIYSCPNGVIRNIDDMENVVETSNNLAIIKTEDSYVKIQCLLRSSVDSAKEDLANMIESVFKLAGGDVIFDGAYPGWKPNLNSPILQVMKSGYKKLYDKEPEVKVIHAGLECGLLGGVYPNLDMISFGPTIKYPHSPDEKVNIKSVERFWNYLLYTLKNIPQK